MAICESKLIRKKKIFFKINFTILCKNSICLNAEIKRNIVFFYFYSRLFNFSVRKNYPVKKSYDFFFSKETKTNYKIVNFQYVKSNNVYMLFYFF